jgi:chromosome partitioning protein
MARVITIANQKGGTGKTTTAINLGAALVIQGEKILLIDMDSQAHCSRGLGIRLKENELSIRDIICDPDKGISKIIRETAIDNLHIAPSHIYLSTVELELASQVGSHRRLAVALEDVSDTYDHIIIDAPPSLGLLAINSIVAAHEVIIPMEAELYALDGMDALEDTIIKTKRYLGHNIEILGVLATKFRKGTSIHTEILEQLKEHWKEKVFDTLIHLNTDIPASVADQLPVVIVRPQSLGGRDYIALAEEVLQREKLAETKTGQKA